MQMYWTELNVSHIIFYIISYIFISFVFYKHVQPIINYKCYNDLNDAKYPVSTYSSPYIFTYLHTHTHIYTCIYTHFASCKQK